MNLTGMEHFLEHTCFIHKDKVTPFLELLLNNCAFSFGGKFYPQLQGATMDSPVYPVFPPFTLNNLKELVLGLQ